MMNRGVMDRQMFRNGGAAGFPDLNNDGKITQKDILMGRGVKFMQDGGMAGIMAAAPGMAGGMAAQDAVPPEAASVAMQSMDPAVLEQMLGSAQQSISNLDDAEDFETVINSIRGDEAPLESRYEELAEIVGPEDAGETPESVLALLQPVMMMNAVDQGIGGLAEAEMTQPVEGDMAGGIMSTVSEPPPEEMPPMGMEGPPPVNFNQGGLVRRGYNQPVQYFAPENRNRVAGGGFDLGLEDSLALYGLAANNDAVPAPTQGDGTRLGQLMDAQKAIYRKYGLGDPEERAAQLEKDKDAMQAQILFDIAQMGLAYAGGVPGERSGMSPAERLAFVAAQTKLPQTIAARVAEQAKAEKASKKEERALDLAALQSAETKLAAEVAAKEARALQRLKSKTTEVKATKAFVTQKPIVLDGVEYPKGKILNLRPNQVAKIDPDALKPYKEVSGEGGAKKFYEVTKPIFYEGQQQLPGTIIAIDSGEADKIEGFATSVKPYKAEEKEDVNIVFPDGSRRVYRKGTDAYEKAITPVDEGGLGGTLGGVTTTQGPESTKPVINTKDMVIKGQSIPAGTPLYLNEKEISSLKDAFGADAFRPYEKADTPPDIFGKGSADKALRYFSLGEVAEGVKAIDAYAEGGDDRIMDSMIAAYTAPVPDARGFMQKRQLPDFVKEAIKKRILGNSNLKSPVPLNTLDLSQEEMQKLGPSQDVPLINPDGTVNIERATADPTFIITGLDYTKSQGFVSSLNRFFNGIAGQLAELGLGTGYAGRESKITSAADKELASLGRRTQNVLRADTKGKVFALDVELIMQEVKGFLPSGAKSDVGALQQLRTVRNSLASGYARAKYILDRAEQVPGAFSSETVEQARLAVMDTEKLIAEYTAAILAYEANIGGRGAGVSSSSGGGITGNLPRVNKSAGAVEGSD